MSPAPPDSVVIDLEQTFVASLPLIDRIVAIQARRYRLSAADAEDFASWAKARIVEDEYAVFRAFGGRSSLATYLSVVLHNLLRDYRNARWGRWRPSVVAVRAGPTAVRLDELLHRDGCSLREATQILRVSGCTLTDAEIARLAAKLPLRLARDEVGIEVAARTPEVFHAPPDPSPDAAEAARVLDCAVRDVMAALPPEDALILRMRFWSGMSVADVARTLHLEQKPLYRRLDAIQARLRDAFAERGIDRDAVSDLLNQEFRP